MFHIKATRTTTIPGTLLAHVAVDLFIDVLNASVFSVFLFCGEDFNKCFRTLFFCGNCCWRSCFLSMLLRCCSRGCCGCVVVVML